MPPRPGAVLEEADAYLSGRSRLQDAARALVRIFEAERIPYAIAGAIALGVHGRLRLREDVDVLIRREDLARFKRTRLGPGARPKSGSGRPDADASPPTALRSLRRSSSYGSVATPCWRRPSTPGLNRPSWVGLLGYVEPAPGLKAVRDTAHDVRIDFLLAGDFPGDGEPKPIAFPDPATRTTEAEGLRVLDLDALIELKLASGMTAAHRGQDLVDVMELIRARSLPVDHAERLHEWVRPKYRELWQLAQVRDDY